MRQYFRIMSIARIFSVGWKIHGQVTVTVELSRRRCLVFGTPSVTIRWAWDFFAHALGVTLQMMMVVDGREGFALSHISWQE